MTADPAVSLSRSLQRRVVAEQRSVSTACLVLGTGLAVEALLHSPAALQRLPSSLWNAAVSGVVSFLIPVVALALLWLLTRRRRTVLGLHPRGSGTGTLVIAILAVMVVTPVTVLLLGAGVWLGGALVAVGGRSRDLLLGWTGLGVVVVGLWASWRSVDSPGEVAAAAMAACAVVVLAVGAVRRRDERRAVATPVGHAYRADDGPHPAAGLDDVIHQRTRLGIVSVLAESRCDFTYLRRVLGLTDGNLNSHLGVRVQAGYVRTEKDVTGGRARTWGSITPDGRAALGVEIRALQSLIARTGVTDA